MSSNINKPKIKNKKKDKERQLKEKYLSFNSIDRMMRDNKGIDDRKCR